MKKISVERILNLCDSTQCNLDYSTFNEFLDTGGPNQKLIFLALVSERRWWRERSWLQVASTYIHSLI